MFCISYGIVETRITNVHKERKVLKQNVFFKSDKFQAPWNMPRIGRTVWTVLAKQFDHRGMNARSVVGLHRMLIKQDDLSRLQCHLPIHHVGGFMAHQQMRT
ncbi:hypothetical protein XELAEV_18010066mg [Xenopus laevis]|uniref:Uncharacterized protein n=1 Tax=Xenopus laevis TaxID=8355 RepID=A0A974I0Z6_XENLA|nr:hypothetical protein XELAEV_18010066mg [Xenopus laevis]